MFSIYNNAKTDKQYRASTGMDIGEFNLLKTYFIKYYKPKMANPYVSAPQPVLVDSGEALFFILHYLKAYPTFENMGIYFGIAPATVCNYIEYIKPALKAALNEKGDLPHSLFKNQEEFDKAFEGIDNLSIDAQEMPVQRSSDNVFQKFNYSGKKKMHTVKTMIISDISKKIYYLGLLWNGKAHDKTIFLKEFENIDFSSKTINVDLAFLGLDLDFASKLNIPHKKPKGGELTQLQKDENKLLSIIRVVVENSIAGLKRYFILRIENRCHYYKKIHDSMLLCAGLWNFKLSA